jgi:hypothetical protein
MAVKKKTTKAGPKALLMKKNVDQLKRKAKQLGVKNISTKKKAQLVQSIMLAEARKKKKPKALTSKTSAKKKTRKISSAIKRPAENSPMVKALEVMDPYTRRKAMKMYGLADRRSASRKPNKPLSGYNGWTNYETWLVNLWFDNSLYEILGEEYGFDPNEWPDTYEVAQSVKYYISTFIFEDGRSENSDLPAYGFVTDALNAFLDQVNYEELAQAVIDQF